jgi:hypothetical protein
MNNERNPKGAGRKALAPDRKKLNYTVTLIPSEAAELERRYGSLTLAIRSVIIQDKPEILPILDKIVDLSAELKALMS